MATAKVAVSIAAAVKKIMMCRPTYFKIAYAINPWMDVRRGADIKLASKQWNKLKDTITAAGAEVHVMEPNGAENFPDIVFSANAAVVRKNKAYLANFHYPERKGERYFYKKWFEANGYETVGDQNIIFEGAGDALWGGKDQSVLFVGIGPRTDANALDDIAQKLDDGSGFKTLGCRLIDPRFYHIDTCFCPLNDELAIYYPYAFDEITRHNMKNEIDLIPLPEKEVVRFACNAVVIKKAVIMNEGNEETAKILQKNGYETHFVNMSEFIKSGGSTKCCTLEI
ncbi:hypothetical protein AB6A40_004487 [Gnathostoma spinigerum]|uniref:Dimethylargininase n=1 Tax=Gnathostoma spinigerum TaxID=75299 RepID=A0ABD6ECT2_9BILA